LISFESAMALMMEKLQSHRLAIERIPVRSAAGRFLVSDVRSLVDQPPFDRSSMDGYAVPAGDLGGDFEVRGIVSAGRTAGSSLSPGTTVKVMTGAPVPPGTERVIKVEQAVERDGRVRFEDPSNRTNIRRRAEDLSAGDVVLKAGTRLGPLEIANLVGCGLSEVEVAKQASVYILSTGDELVDSVDLLAPGKIMNSNGPLVARLAERYGLKIAGEEAVPDDPARLEAALERAKAAVADVVVFTGGVSVGDFDFVPQVVTGCGFEIHFSRVAIKPGKPLTFATDDSTLLFGLPGNPVSVYLMFQLVVFRAVAIISGGDFVPRTHMVRLAEPFHRRSAERSAFQPYRLSADGLAVPIEYHGSGHLTALLEADGFILVPRGVTTLQAQTVMPMIFLE
jgi:molybdopterin molybdotransferase